MFYSRLIINPMVDDVIFDLCCSCCCNPCGLPEICCQPHAHVLCRSCYKQGVTKCALIFGDAPGNPVCNGALFGVDEVIEKAPYFQHLLKFQFKCGMHKMGCNERIPGSLIREHELNLCPFR